MSYQNDLEKGKKPTIEMPPLPEENTEQPQLDLHPSLKQAMPEQVEQEVVEQPKVEQQVEAQPEPQPVEESYQAKNFRQLKEQNEKIRRERDEYVRKLKEYETSLKQQPQSPTLNDDDIVEAKHLKKYDETLKQIEQRMTLTADEIRLKATYPDIEKVVSSENLETLRSLYPEVADSINSNPSFYGKASAAYNIIKRLGIVQEDTYMAEKQKIQQNAAKPKPLASISPKQGDSPLSQANAFANGLTPELQKQLYKEMIESMKKG